jgi:hypothetical protein
MQSGPQNKKTTPGGPGAAVAPTRPSRGHHARRHDTHFKRL